MAVAGSPYELVLGESISELHPRLQAYFRGIPDGHHGVGTGTFTTVGTPRRWLWPVLWVLARQGVLFPVWERSVPFTVVNAPTRGTTGTVQIRATRTFRFHDGDRHMLDALTVEGAELVDYLGNNSRYRARFVASVSAGSLTMSMTSLEMRFRTTWMTVPRWISPTVTLTERFDDESRLQHVEVITTVPGLGRIYEYAGSFEYELRLNQRGNT